MKAKIKNFSKLFFNKFKKKFFKFAEKKLILNKIRFQFARHEKIRIAVNYFVIIIGSFLMLLSFFVPTSLLTFLYGSINSVKPYNSYVKYQSIPWNDFHGNMIIGKIDGKIPDKGTWQNSGFPATTVNDYIDPVTRKNIFSNDEKLIYGYYNTSPIYPTFTPSNSNHKSKENNFYHYLAPGAGTFSPTASPFLAATAKYIGGYVFDNEWLATIGKLKEQAKIVCQMLGSEKENPGACIIDVMSKKLPQYVFNKVIDNSNDKFYKDASISFGAVPFDPLTDDKFTYINSKFKGNNLEVWGVDDNFKNKNVTNLLKNENSSNNVINVVVNTAVQKYFKLNLYQEYPIDFFQNVVDNDGNSNDLVNPFNTHINMESQWADNNVNLICVPGTPQDCYDLNSLQKNSNDWTPHYTYGIFNKQISSPKIDKEYLNVSDSISHKVANKEYNIDFRTIKKKIKVVGVENQISNFKVYAKQSDINNIIFTGSENFSNQKDKLDTFKKLYFNGKFSEKYQLDDDKNISLFNPYGDYTQQGLNGGIFRYPNYPDQANLASIPSDHEEYKAFATSTVIDEWSHQLFFGKIYQIIGGFTLLFVLFTVLIFLLSFVIMLSCCNILIHDNKKQILIMKSLGYKNKEINAVTTGIFFITIICSFLTVLIISYIIGYYLVSEVLVNIYWYISYWFIIISLFFTFLVLLAIYFTVRYFTIRSLNKLDMKQVLQK